MRVDYQELDENAPVFSIAAAAELAGMHPQTLRQYDRLGLVVPQRTASFRSRRRQASTKAHAQVTSSDA